MDENNVVQTDSDIIAEFEDLFGGSESSQETVDESVDDENIETEDESDELDEAEEDVSEDLEDEEESDEEDEEESPKKKPVSDRDKKQREAFYSMRTQLKAYDKLFGKLGKLFDLSESGDPNEIVAKIEKAITQKEAQQSNVPVEFLERFQELESIVNKQNANERENRVTEELAVVGQKYKLDTEAMQDFLLELADEDKNPLEVDVDLEAEYIKRHLEEILENARNEGIQQETNRQDKVKNKAPGSLPDKKDKSGSESKIETVEELNNMLDSL